MTEKEMPLAVAVTTTSGALKSDLSARSTAGFAFNYTGEERPLQDSYTRLAVYATGSNEPEGYSKWEWQAVDVDGLCHIAESHGYSQEITHQGVGMTDPNHVACYWAVISALGWIAANAPDESADLLTSSRLVVQQVNGVWQCRTPHLLRLRNTATALLSLTDTRLLWMPDSSEARAEALSCVVYGEAIAGIGEVR
jgi:ribonuclease HI